MTVLANTSHMGCSLFKLEIVFAWISTLPTHVQGETETLITYCLYMH